MLESPFFADLPDFSDDVRTSTNSDAVWLLSTIKSLCVAANVPGRYDELAEELVARNIVPSALDTAVAVVPPRVGSPFSQVYSNLAVIGEGGYGQVFKVQNLIDKQIYALKVVPIQEDEVASAVREVQCLARMGSPRIVRYYTSWLEETGDDSEPLSLFIQMEFVHGRLLSEYLERRTEVDVRFVMEVICELAEALAEIHKNGIVHRDFRPANVLLREEGTICVIDFGIASLHEKKGTEAPAPARTGSLAAVRPIDELCLAAAQKSCTLREVGTPIYSSPSQLSGSESRPKDDIYSFGITIFEMLTLFRTNMEKVKAVKALRSQRVLPESFRADFPDMTSLILEMTDPKHQNRPSADKVAAVVAAGYL
jgi:serine/threonine protein kinase